MVVPGYLKYALAEQTTHYVSLGPVHDSQASSQSSHTYASPVSVSYHPVFQIHVPVSTDALTSSQVSQLLFNDPVQVFQAAKQSKQCPVPVSPKKSTGQEFLQSLDAGAVGYM